MFDQAELFDYSYLISLKCIWRLEQSKKVLAAHSDLFLTKKKLYYHVPKEIESNMVLVKGTKHDLV